MSGGFGSGFAPFLPFFFDLVIEVLAIRSIAQCAVPGAGIAAVDSG
jgi:hypothetical protein